MTFPKRILPKGLIYSIIFYLSILTILIILNFIFPLKINLNYSTIIESSDSTVIHSFLNNEDKWRMYTELSEISPILKKAIIFKEDKYFYQHFGINPFAICRALFNNVIKGRRTSGASTITMQVIRLLNPKKRTYFNKLIEIFRALQLELKYSKDEILQLYLNLVPYGGNIEGVKSASILYFNKKPYLLSIAEIATLSIIPNRPNSLTLGVDNEYIMKERNKWLQRYLNAQLFEKQDILDALEEPLTAIRIEAPKLAPHFSIRMKKMFPNQNIIKTSIDINKQIIIQSFVNNYIKRLYNKNIKNAVVLVIDNSSHKVVSYIGSADFYNTEDGGQVDGIQAIRSPGSTLKPLLYANAFDLGLITPKFVIADVPTNYSGYAPENYNDKFNGNVTIEYSLAHSLNVPAVKILDLITIEIFLKTLKKAGFKKIIADKSKLGLSLILGGCGVTLEELTKVYSAFANDGMISEISYLQNDTIQNSSKIISKQAAFLITEILTQVTRPDLPMEWQNSSNIPKIAWKTGTSYGRKDAWSIGYNKQYTIGVWVGNFSAESVSELSGSEYAAPLLFNIFNTLEYNNKADWFFKPFGLDFRQVCSESGLIPNNNCSNLILDYYIPAVSNVNICNHLKEVCISPDSSVSYCTSCLPSNGYIKAIYNNYSPEIISYYDKYQIKYDKIPIHNTNCERVFNENEPQITSPISNIEYWVDKIDSTQIKLSCDVSNDVEKIFWYVNDKFYKSAIPGETLFFTPPAGQVKISCSDDKARNSNVWITVKYIAY